MKLSLSKTRVYELVAVLIVLVLFSWLAHVWVSDRMLELRLSYFVDSLVAKSTVKCDKSELSWLNDLITYSLSNRGAIANQVAYVSPSGESFSCTSGWSGGFQQGELLDENARFRYASTTKIITASVILDLVREGRLQFDSTIGSLFPEIVEYKDERVSNITIGQLLNHSAGFDRMHIGDPMFFSKKKPWCPNNMMNLSRVTLQFTPGEKQAYSNVGYCLLGVIAERATGLSFRTLLEEKYKLASLGIVFIDGPRLPDEVVSDFRHEELYEENYFKDFDFISNSATAGLSGSALALAGFVHQIIFSDNSSFLASSTYSKCDMSKLHGCYGIAFYQYKQVDNDLIVGIQGGYLPGSTSVVLVDNYGGVLVLLNAGKPFDIMVENERTYVKIYKMLSDFYREKTSSKHNSLYIKKV